MADKDLGDGPSLEMPSLGNLFRRKKGKQEPAPDDSLTPTQEELDAVVRGRKPSEASEPPADSATPADESPEPVTETPEVAEEPVAEAVAEPESPAPAVVDATAPETTVTEPSTEPDSEPTVVLGSTPDADDTSHTAVLEDLDTVDPQPAPPVQESPATAAPAPAAEPAAPAQASVADDDIDDRPLFTDEVTEPAAAMPSPEPAGDVTDEDLTDDEDDEDESAVAARRRAPRERRTFTLPALPGRVAAAITGLVIGALAVAMTYLAVQGCEAVKGTSSCGTPGFFLLIAIMILLVVIGSALLGAWKVADPGSTSFLAVGLVAVIALLFLIRVIFSPWMVVVIPAVAVVTFVVSQWLTSLFIEDHGTPE
ncbi:hypothetical protein [Nocardioides sp. Root140]|uniref:hypothetical protein n=1 Tax=Nocardioides sp. Root140 TaxID=1736460 RepID=UPI0006F30D25|nr:hypothetical protein [Nocardioides sp. Root140]